MSPIVPGPIPAPSNAIDCSPEVKVATATAFELWNTHPAKSPPHGSNFIEGNLTNGVLVFVVENLPKTTPPSGCSGTWMFHQMMDHFGASVTAIQGTWIGSQPGDSDNLDMINQLTVGDAMSLEAAAKQTWTGKRAKDRGFPNVQLASSPRGTPGQYTKVEVLFNQ